MFKQKSKWQVIEETAKAINMKVGRELTSKQLAKGMKVLAYYNSTNQGCDAVEIMGVTGSEQEYGEGGVKFNSVSEALAFYNCKTLTELETLQNKNEYGYHSYLWLKDLETREPKGVSSCSNQDNGPWYYVFQGRWSCGSGAEALSFIELKTVDEDLAEKNKQVAINYRNGVRSKTARLARELVALANDNPEIELPYNLAELVTIDQE